MKTTTKRILLAVCYLVCVIFLNKNIYIFIPSNVVSEVFVAIFVAGIMITVALTVVYITLDKMLKESEE